MKSKYFFVIMFMMLLIVPQVMAVWWNPFTWFKSDNTISLEESPEWKVLYNDYPDLYPVIVDPKNKESDIYLCSYTATDKSQLKDLEFYTSTKVDGKELDEKAKLKAVEYDNKFCYSYKAKTEDKYLKFGNESTHIAYIDENILIYQGDDLIGEASLITEGLEYKNGKPHVDIFPGKNQTVHKFLIVDYQDTDNIIDNVSFIDMRFNKSFERDYHIVQIVYENTTIPIYNNSCPNDDYEHLELCTQVFSHNEYKMLEKEIDVDYDNLIEGEDYIFAIKTDVNYGDYFDIVPQINGQFIDLWATVSGDLSFGLTTFYSMDEEANTTGTIIDATDTVNATNVGGVNTTGLIDYGYRLERSSNDYIDTNYVPATGSQDRTGCVWFYPTTLTNEMVFFAYGDTGSYEKYSFRIDDASGDVLRIEIQGVGFSSNLKVSTTNQWYLACVTLNGTTFGDHTLYLGYPNGTLFVESPPVSAITVNTVATNDAWIGSSSMNALQEFNGTVDLVGFWNISLTQTQIETYFNNGSGIPYYVAPSSDIDVNLLFPADNYTTSSSSIDFACECESAYNNCTELNMTIDGSVVNTTTGTGNLSLNYSGTFSDGDYDWYCNASNSSVVFNSSVYSFSVDATTPIVNITSPVNDTTLLNPEFTINYTFNDTNINNCYYNSTFNSTPTVVLCNSTSVDLNYSTSFDDTEVWFFYAVDDFNNTGSSNVQISRSTTVPSITYISPLTSYDDLQNGDDIDLNVTVSTSGTLDSCWYTYPLPWNGGSELTYPLSSDLYDNNDSTFESSFYYEFYFNNTDQNLTYRGADCDSSSCSNYYNVTVDTTSCGINDTYTINSTNIAQFGCNIQTTLKCDSTTLYQETSSCLSEPFNKTVDLFPSNKISLNISDNAIPLTCNTNTTFVFQAGSQEVYFYANDTLGNLGNENQSWIILSEIGSILYNNITFETQSEEFTVNVTLDASVNSVTGSFYYNGTEYTAVPSTVGNVTTLTSNIDIPVHGVDINYSLYFELNITNENGSTTVTTSTVNQTSLALELFYCEGNLTEQFINYTTRSATSPYPELNTTFGSTWSYYLSTGNGTQKVNFSYEDLNQDKSVYAFCFNYPNMTIVTTNEVEVDATGFTQASNFLTGQSLTNTTTTKTIYLLNESLAFATVLQVYDSNQFPIPGVTIDVDLYDVGTDSFLTVTQVTTSSEGSTVVYLNWLDSTYKFSLTQNNETILTTLPEILFESPRIFTIDDDFTFTYNKFLGIDYSLTFNSTSKIFTLTYLNSDQLYDEACLAVVQKNSGGDTSICDTCQSATSGTISCDVSSYGNGTYQATFYATGSLQAIDWIVEVIGDDFSVTLASAIGQDDRTFYAFLMGILIVSIMFFNPVLGIVAILISMFISSFLGFVPFDYLVMIGLSVTGGIIAWLIK